MSLKVSPFNDCLRSTADFQPPCSFRGDSQLHSDRRFPYAWQPLEIIDFLSEQDSLLSQLPLRSSDRPISIGQLHTSPCFHLRPINLIVFKGSYYLSIWIPYLEVSFTLRCFQRLSNPHFATLPCRWRDNRCTIGAFIPVLSY